MHKIPIILSSDENYSRYMYVTILSILENKNDDTFCDFYLLVPNKFSSFINKEFYKLQERYTNCAINFVEMDSDFTKLKMSISHITYPTYYRLKMAELLPQYDKVIYLDTDVIVEKDLSEYYNIDLNDNYVGGVCAIGYAINWDKNIKAYESYGINDLKDLVNAGVTLWNLKKIREENLTQQLMSMIPNNYGGQDQDIINIAFHKNIKFVPLKFNLMTKYPQLTDKTHKDYCLLKEVFGEDNIEEAIKSPVIIHYADRVKPWKNSRCWLAFKWWEYAKKSPFFINFIINRYICVEKRADRIIFNFFGIKLKIKRNFHENDKSIMGLLKNIQREIKKYKLKQKINEDISKYKYVHIMYNDKFNKPFVDFLNKYFDSNEHMVLCYRSSTDYVARPFPEGKNVYEFIKLDGLNLRAQNIEKIIFHSLFRETWVDYLYKNKKLLNKSYWAMWGGDLYNPPRDEKNDYVRKNFRGYLNDIDREYALNKYGMNDNFFKMFYNFPISKIMLNSTKSEPHDYIKIQINNSCDESTLEVLDMLSKFKDENIRITTILSYARKEYKDAIIQKGRELFGEKFEYIEELMSPFDYANHLAQNDILILNQRRQQGVGNTLASLYLGKKVFIREEISTNKYFNNEGIKIFNTNDISTMSFDELIEYKEKAETQKCAGKYYDDEFLAELLRKVFD